MAEANQPPTESFPWKAIVTVVAGLLASGALLLPFLTSSRPSIPWGARSEGMSIQDIDARLWQDPLEAIETKQHQLESQYDKRTHSVELVRQKLAEGARPLILAVMVNPDGYAEKIERRLRDRVAVEYALGRAGYSPDDAEHLGSFTIPWSRYPENLRSVNQRLVPSSTSKTLWEGDIDSTHFVLSVTVKDTRTTVARGPNGDGATPLWRRSSEDSIHPDSANDALLTVPFEFHELDTVGHPNAEQAPTIGPRADRILVLWLRQNFFDDFP